MTMTARKLAGAVLMGLSISSSAASGTSAAEKVCERHMAHYAKTYELPLGILYAVGLTETGRRETLHPHALNIEGKSRFAKDRRSALAIFRSAHRKGARLIDVGRMQINHHWHGKAFSSLEEMFDPQRNVAYAARFLRRLRAREGNWTLAVARYHAGPNNNPAQKRYVCSVIRNMVASGFGRWTAKARKFCK